MSSVWARRARVSIVGLCSPASSRVRDMFIYKREIAFAKVLQPRPGHVYLQTGDRLRESTPRFADSLIFRVHHKSLDPNLLNPDEDVLRWNPRQFNLVPYNERKNQNESGGEWANRKNATDPEMSQHSMEQGVIAHKGVIPPQHLEVQKDGNWEPLIPRTSHRVAEYPGGGDM